MESALRNGIRRMDDVDRIMPNRLDRPFFQHQDEFEKKRDDKLHPEKNAY